MAFYGQLGLNSGVNAFHNETLEFDDNRFSFLKLHGSVGMFAHDDAWGSRSSIQTLRQRAAQA